MTEDKLAISETIINQPKDNTESGKTKEVKELALREAMQLLHETINDWRSEVSFASSGFAGYTSENQASLTAATASMHEGVKNLENILQSFAQSSKKIQDQTKTLALLPTKTHQKLKELISAIGNEVEKIHSKRLEEIIAHVKQSGQELKDNIWQSQKLIEETTERSIRKIEEFQYITLESNKKQIADLAQTVRKEVEAITSNHGRKFLRNIAITIILATISGGLTSWSVGTYFPRLVHIARTGDITVKDSAVKIMEGNNPKINDSNHTIKVNK